MTISVPSKIKDRINQSIKKFTPIIRNAVNKDLNESDTVTIITDILCEMLGYDKFNDITSEFAIKRTYCDLAIVINKKIKYLVECKSADTVLNENHIKQATDYGANQGIDWVILTNGSIWKIYKIGFQRPITNELVFEFNLLEADKQTHQLIYLLTKEALPKQEISEYYDYKKLLNKYVISQLLMTRRITTLMQTLLKKLSPDCRPTNEELANLLRDEIIKRDCLDDDEAKAAKRKVAAFNIPQNRGKKKSPTESGV